MHHERNAPNSSTFPRPSKARDLQREVGPSRSITILSHHEMQAQSHVSVFVFSLLTPVPVRQLKSQPALRPHVRTRSTIQSAQLRAYECSIHIDQRVRALSLRRRRTSREKSNLENRFSMTPTPCSSMLPCERR